MSGPSVSVVLPTCDRAHVLERAVRSVLDAQPAVLELVVVDDASQDGTLSLLEGLQDERIRVLRRPSRGGAASARNAGIARARGDVVAFIDSDDAWVPGKLARDLAALERAGGWRQPLLHVTGFAVPFAGGVRHGGPLRTGEASVGALVSGRSGEWVTSCFLLTREALDRGVRFDTDLAALEDQDLAVQVAATGGRVLATTAPYVLKSPRAADSLSSHANLARGHSQFLAKHLGAGWMTRRGRWEHALDAAWSARACGEDALAAEVLRAHVPRSVQAAARRPGGLRVLRAGTQLAHPTAWTRVRRRGAAA